MWSLLYSIQWLLLSYDLNSKLFFSAAQITIRSTFYFTVSGLGDSDHSSPLFLLDSTF